MCNVQYLPSPERCRFSIAHCTLLIAHWGRPVQGFNARKASGNSLPLLDRKREWLGMKGKGPCFFHTLGNLLHRVRTPEVFALAAVLALPAGALALGVRIPNQDPVAIARGNAFVATADNPSAIYYNPAGISQLQGQIGRAHV